MTETRLGRQTPTQSVTIPYSKTRGQEAAELYAKTGNELLEGITALLRSEEMRATIQKHAERIAGTSGGTVETYVAQTRAVAEVTGDDGNNSLLKAVGK